MIGDVKIDDTSVLLEGDAVNVKANVLRCDGWDIQLDGGSGRRARLKDDKGTVPAQNPVVHRRALVHDVGDILTINYAADYAGGIELGGAGIVGDVVLLPSRGKSSVSVPRLDAVFGFENLSQISLLQQVRQLRSSVAVLQAQIDELKKK